jgi:hypothetical protein
MKARLFKTIEAMTEEISDMQLKESDRRHDRALVSNFYNGGAPLSPEQAAEMGFRVNVNSLLGYSEIANAKEQVLSLYNKPPRTWTVTLRDAPIQNKKQWETRATMEWNDIMRKSGRLKPAYEGVSGDATLHGLGTFHFSDPTDWCPSHLSLAKLLVPDEAKADPRTLTHFAIETEISLDDIAFHRRKKSFDWKQDVLTTIWNDFVKAKRGANDVAETYDSTNEEQMEYFNQTNDSQSSYSSPSIKVFYFYQRQPGTIKRSFDMDIICQYKVERKDDPGKKPVEEIMYSKRGFADGVFDVLHPFFMDCMIGGDQLWHRIMGLGILNFDLNRAVEILMSRAMDGTMENSMTLWQAEDSASREELQQILMRHNGIIPENVRAVPNREPVDLNALLGLVQFYRAQGSRNALQFTQTSQSPMQPTGGPKQQQAIASQNQVIGTQGNRTANWYEYLDRLGAKIFERFTNRLITSDHRGYSEISEFQARMRRAGIPLSLLQPSNVVVMSFRLVGEGIKANELQIAQFLDQHIDRYPPESRPVILQQITAAITGDWEFAERVSPVEQKPDQTQVLRAQTEENTALTQGKTPPLNPDDIDLIHLQSHLPAIQMLIQKAGQVQKQSFTPDQLIGFKALAGHTMAHIQKVKSMGQEEMAKQALKQLLMLSNMAQKFANNLKQQQQSEQVNPVEAAKLKLAALEAQRKARKDQVNESHRERQQRLRETESAQRLHFSIDQANREDMKTKADLAARDVELAHAIATTPMPALEESE